MSNKIFQNTISEWQDKTFPDATIESIKTHLAEELLELVGEEIFKKALDKHLRNNKVDEDNDNEESADIVLLLNHLAHKSEFNLLDETEDKFEKNKKRKWGKPDINGVVNHIKE
jgi:NTP pyrophosphatase (non-canonical NTP hydrolase)